MSIGCGKSQTTNPGPEKHFTPEETLFRKHCASCHGSEGKADTTSAATFKLRPLTARPWKGTPEVTKEYIRKITLEGIPNTAMPALKTLSKSDLDLLVDYVYKLATTKAPGKDAKAKE